MYARVSVRKYCSSKGRAEAPGTAGLQMFDCFASTRNSPGLNRTRGGGARMG